MDALNELCRLFEKNRNLENAVGMEKYMKNHFPFMGLKMPERKKLEREFYSASGILKNPFSPTFVEELWNMPEREFQYAALGYLEKFSTFLDPDDLPLLKWLITEKSWWDTVDTLAQKPVGVLAGMFPEVRVQMDQWAVSNNTWLRRTAILHQLKYKNKTDSEKLYTYIKQNSDSKEFFIQKAIGWALREYSKTNPASVKGFILNTKLSPLSIREGSKYLDQEIK